MKVHIGLAGLPYEVELRFWLACKLLMSSSTPVQLHKWDGMPCDMLVADLDSEQGQVAYERAMHNDTRVLFLSKDQHTEHLIGTRIDKHATASAIAKMLENRAHRDVGTLGHAYYGGRLAEYHVHHG